MLSQIRQLLPRIKTSFLLLGLTSAITVSQSQASQVIIPAAPQLASKAYLLIDADTGKVIIEHNADLVLPPASLTKMMTGYIVSEEIMAGRLKESELVRISDDAWRRGGAKSGSSTMFLNPRTEVPVIDLLRGVIIQSGNDASIALAEHIAGNESAFADVMNQQAQLLGMKDTQFKNATGWPAKGHHTTAHDLAILAKSLINDHPEHYSIYSEKYFKYNGINQPNRNKLLFTDKFVDGIKTGHTNEAGFGLVSSAEKNDMRLIAVVLGAKSESQRANDSQRILVYGFRYYQTHSLYTNTDVLSQAKVWAGLEDQLDLGVRENIIATIPRGSHKNLNAEIQVDSVIKAPIQKGQVLGKLLVSLDGEALVEEDLVALSDVAEAGFVARMWDALMLMVVGSDSSE